MKFHFLILLLASMPCFGQSLDTYGGDANHICVGIYGKNGLGETPGNPIAGATGYFYLYKDTNLHRWMFCDPLGNRFFLQGVQNIADQAVLTINTNTKYGSSANFYGYQVIRLKALGFNTEGQEVDGPVLPVDTTSSTANAQKAPFITEESPAHYALVNGSGSVKDMTPLMPPNYNGYRGDDGVDFFDPAWTTYVNGVFTTTFAGFPGYGTIPAALDASPWLLAVGLDDSDYLWNLHGDHGGWMAGMFPPYLHYQMVNRQFDTLYSDPVVYTKAQLSTNLQAEYTTLAALNAAWGSTYTTFGSTATTVSSEAIGTGDGSTTTFTHTFAHTPIDPGSLYISVAGTPSAGDCPWFEYYCANLSQNTTGLGDVIGVASNILNDSTEVNYSSGTVGGITAGKITVTFSVAPANGAAITASYQYGGWPKAFAGGTGLLDEDGTSAWWPADPGTVTPPVGNIVATDLDTFWGQLCKQYYSTETTAYRTSLPHHLMLSQNGLAMMTSSTELNQAAAYLDFINGPGNSPAPGDSGDPNNSPAIVNPVYNLTGLPMIAYFTIVTSNDSPYTYANCAANGQPARCTTTQALRGASYLQWSNDWWNRAGGVDGQFIGADNYNYMAGWSWWSLYDKPSEDQNFGLISAKDNIYGYPPICPTKQEDVNSSITDCYGFTTTAETTTYGNFVNSGVVAGNGLWLLVGGCPGCGTHIGMLPLVAEEPCPPCSLKVTVQ